MFVGTPFRELREVIEDLLRVRVEDMRAVFVHQHAERIEVVVSVAGDVRTDIAKKHFFACTAREAFRHYTACVASADDQKVIHGVRSRTVRRRDTLVAWFSQIGRQECRRSDGCALNPSLYYGPALPL